MPKTISYAQLQKLGGRQEHLDRFSKTFGEEVTVSHDLVPQIVGLGFDIDFVAFHLLPRPIFKAVYEGVTRPAYAALEASITPADIAYAAAKVEVEAQVYEDGYYAALEAAEDAYEAASKAAEDAYDLIKAHAFVDAYLAS